MARIQYKTSDAHNFKRPQLENIQCTPMLSYHMQRESYVNFTLIKKTVPHVEVRMGLVRTGNDFFSQGTNTFLADDLYYAYSFEFFQITQVQLE